jgi:hypothetical protein
MRLGIPVRVIVTKNSFNERVKIHTETKYNSYKMGRSLKIRRDTNNGSNKIVILYGRSRLDGLKGGRFDAVGSSVGRGRGCDFRRREVSKTLRRLAAKCRSLS